MSEDDSSGSNAEQNEKKRSWLERLTSAFSGEPHTRDELVAVLHTAQEDGLIAADTLRMMEGAISVAELTVGDVMISRSQMVSLPVEAPFLELMKQVVESGHSRFPVHGDNKDDILGVLLAKDLLRGVVADHGPANVRELLRPAVLIPEAKKLNVLLKEFRLSRNHMAIVVDEYGGVAGPRVCREPAWSASLGCQKVIAGRWHSMWAAWGTPRKPRLKVRRYGAPVPRPIRTFPRSKR